MTYIIDLCGNPVEVIRTHIEHICRYKRVIDAKPRRRAKSLRADSLREDRVRR